MRWLWDLGFLGFALVSLPRFLGRLSQAEDPWRLLRERLGFFPPSFLPRFQGTRPIWIHGVSVGEVLAVEKLIQLLFEKRPDAHEKLLDFKGTDLGRLYEDAFVRPVRR